MDFNIIQWFLIWTFIFEGIIVLGSIKVIINEKNTVTVKMCLS